MSGRWGRAVVGAAAVLALVAGCGAVPSGAPEIGGSSAPPPKPTGVEELTAPPSAAAAADPSCDATASLRPAGPLPAAGQVPAGSTMARILEKGRLTVGVDQNTYLMGFRNPFSGELEGFDVDMAREVAKALFGDPTRINFKVLTSEQRIPALEDREVDIVVRTMTVNCERWQKVAFSSVYYQAGQRVLVPSTSDVTGIESLGGRRVCATKGSSSLVNVATAAAKPIAVAVPNWTDCLVMLQQGQVDAISTDNTILAGFAAQDPYTKVVGPQFTAEPYGMAFPKQDEDFVRFVNALLEQLRANGTWASIHGRWLGDPPAPPVANYRD
ncbi:glutamate ABC transporter substrate-binding protein [Actinosynnema sp. NPDC047251]|uniref:ABC-type transporter, substrate-binding lipoprotein, family 3 n=1 Tax=Saccharothrix espanaensis (strain ATCC 51144 / DSM 44229 / JCM 9112 / NBRC 15066 / NRRL 15764) TaxID=1179773 RepID=K0K1Q2_SACES|nr:glutamate ABC transporter substrate-binding protein [Saccharothrix espanaensis]CCH31497.1 ABC-type transporter, substrate-binding lipoprotein, family 3 [Saccharothrix espanaensis DSM 44229]